MKTKEMKKKTIIGTIGAILIISLAYWIYSLFYLSTDDAYINANIVHISPRVTGQISTLFVTNNEHVSENQALFRLDPAPFEVAIDEAKAQLNAATANVSLAEATAVRTASLLQRRVASIQESDTTQATLQSSRANLQLATANLKQAELNLEYTNLTSPTSGWVTNMSIRVGDVVTANQSLFALVSDKEYWVDANFKETEIHHIHPGQHAIIMVDMYPDYPFEGKVESISSGSGAAFSLLPPENATGNWVKVTQRVPVRIRILNPDPHHPLRVGTTATVTLRIGPWS